MTLSIYPDLALRAFLSPGERIKMRALQILS